MYLFSFLELLLALLDLTLGRICFEFVNFEGHWTVLNIVHMRLFPHVYNETIVHNYHSQWNDSLKSLEIAL